MTKLTELKLWATGFFSALTAWLGTLAIPVYILVGLNMADYFTGMAAAGHRGERVSSRIGLWGIAKKMCMWLLVGLGAVVDWLVLYAAQAIGFASPVQFLVASAAAVWLICNELLSILENISEIGVQTPAFLHKLVEMVKADTEEKTKP